MNLFLLTFILIMSILIWLVLFINDRTNNYPIVVGITTIPSRINKCKRIVESITNGQSMVPDSFILTIPRKYRRFPNETLKVPSFLYDNPLVRIMYIKKDYGPATKFIGPIAYSGLSANTTVVITDDDGVKNREWLSTLVHHVHKNPNSIVTLGQRIIHGGRGFAFRNGIFDSVELIKTLENHQECFLVDDDFLTHYCKIKKIPIIELDRRDLWNPETAEFGNKLRELGGENKRLTLSKKCAKSFGLV